MLIKYYQQLILNYMASTINLHNKAFRKYVHIRLIKQCPFRCAVYIRTKAWIKVLIGTMMIQNEFLQLNIPLNDAIYISHMTTRREKWKRHATHYVMPALSLIFRGRLFTLLHIKVNNLFL